MKKNTEVLVFGPSGSCQTQPVDLGFLASYIKPKAVNLGFRIDDGFKLDDLI